MVTFLVAVSVFVITALSFYRNKKTVNEYYLKNIETYNHRFNEYLDQKLTHTQKLITQLTDKETVFVRPFLAIQQEINDSLLSVQQNKLHNYFKTEIFSGIAKESYLADIYLLNTQKADPTIVYQHSTSEPERKIRKFKNIDNEAVNAHALEIHPNHPVRESEGYFTYITYPIKLGSQVVGLLALKINLADLAQKNKTENPFGENLNVQTHLLKINKNELFALQPDTAQNLLEIEEELLHHIKTDWMKSKGGSHRLREDGKTQLSNWIFRPDLGVALLSSAYIGKNQYNQSNFNTITLIIGFGIIFGAFLLATLFSKIITQPILKLKRMLHLMSKGVLPQGIKTELNDEIGEMIKTVNTIAESLKETANFAQSIGKGQFDTNFKPISGQDTLGNALIDMKESLQNASSKDEVRNWIVEGLAQIGTILRSYSTIKEISQEVISFICHRVKSLQGAIFITQQDQNHQEILELRATYAFGKKKNLNRSFRFGEGLVGQAAYERNIIIRSEIPKGYTLLTSGLLGDQQPSHLLIVPLIYDDVVYGVIELASFTMFDSDTVDFMEEVSSIISRTIFNISVNENTRLLLEQAQKLGTELTQNKTRLEQNAQEMAHTQVVLTQTNLKLQEQISKVKQAQERQTALLSNASEVIFILDQNGIATYVSPSVDMILGYSENDLIGTPEKPRVKTQDQEDFENFYHNLAITPDAKLTMQYEYFKKDGSLVWLEAVGINQLDNPAIKGIVINARDITIKRQAEEAQRKRAQMQALSENSTDMIMRVGLDLSMLYANPAIERYTNKPVTDLLSKKLNESFINSYSQGAYSQLLQNVIEKNHTCEIEADFNDGQNQKILSIKGIPEYNKSVLESVLIVSHDITEDKIAEREILEKSKQIEDSIYYAENIQEVLLPNLNRIKELIPNSFVLFKPRDIVSGDFPWAMEHNGYLYLAAVDCTGHGVPGAMIATVGYFLLNSILQTDQTPHADEVLNELDRLVTNTFKQNEEDSKLKDGMDMVILRIDLAHQMLETASANRPIYHYSKTGMLHEIKGDKFPIGGGKAYTNKTKFTKHTLKFDEGDGFYFFSDGLPDQFNERSDKKFGTSRIKEILGTNHLGHLKQTEAQLEEAFRDWKGKGDQTDDILMIGLKF